MAETISEVAPQEILEAYYPHGITYQEEIKDGEVNTTLLVTDKNGERSILQRLSDIYDASIGEDYDAVATYLTEQGWEMATVLKASDGIAYRPDNSGRVWRSFSYIDSEPGSKFEGDLEASITLGGLLGSLHNSLDGLDYRPKFVRPHHQNTNYYATRLQEVLSEIPDEANRKLAAEMIALSNDKAIESMPPQLIHGDPRIGNSLFREGKPFTYIDWDGFKIGYPLTDVGNLLQSTAGEVITKGKGRCTIEELLPIIDSYYSKVEVNTDSQAFVENALELGRIIAINLGMRHLIDIIEDSYFKWDSSRFESGLDFNLYSARRQQKIYNVFRATK